MLTSPLAKPGAANPFVDRTRAPVRIPPVMRCRCFMTFSATAFLFPETYERDYTYILRSMFKTKGQREVELAAIDRQVRIGRGTDLAASSVQTDSGGVGASLS